MTRRASDATFRAQVTATAARLVAAGKAEPPRLHLRSPARPARIPPGHVRVTVPIRQGDRTLDRDEALATLADHPRADQLVWRCTQPGRAGETASHVFTYDPRKPATRPALAQKAGR